MGRKGRRRGRKGRRMGRRGRMGRKGRRMGHRDRRMGRRGRKGRKGRRMGRKGRRMGRRGRMGRKGRRMGHRDRRMGRRRGRMGRKGRRMGRKGRREEVASQTLAPISKRKGGLTMPDLDEYTMEVFRRWLSLRDYWKDRIYSTPYWEIEVSRANRAQRRARRRRCEDCRWGVREGYGVVCTFGPVWNWTSFERQAGRDCGPEGKLWQPKEDGT
jgi:hypothetical protein